jgi:transcriptional regulator with XRE-family HTH domain
MEISWYNISMKQSDKFGENLREIRKKRGYTQDQLAKATGLSRRIISHYETLAKCPSIEKINKISEVLNISINDLMGNTTLTVKKHKTDDVSFKILKKVRVIEKLPLRDQNAIFHYINAIVEKNKRREEIHPKNKKQ